MKCYVVINIGDSKINTPNNVKEFLEDKYNVKIQNVKDNNDSIIFDVVSNNYDSIKSFVCDYFKDDEHLNLIHEIES